MKSKLKIMKAKPEITDDEIRAYMNFDTLLSQTNQTIRLKKRNRILLGTLAGVVVITGIWFFLQLKEKSQPSTATEQKSNSSTKIIPQNKIADSLSAQPTENKNQDQPVKTLKKSVPDNQVERKKPSVKEDAPQHEPVYILAEPVDGYPALYDYFSRALLYPAEAVKDSVHGVVTVVFSINTAGKPEKIYIENSLGPLFDREAIRVIENMPLWKPASYNNKPVTSKMSLPLTFQLKKKL